jgi:predicted regulator of Ras-like GTPase activity (Roadblock/LC7/MglB family)
MPMEAILKEINSVIGVTGSFVCLSDGSISARALPDSFDAASVTLAARLISQTFLALETSGQRVTEADLTFAQNRVILKNLRGGVLAILCARNINLPLLNLQVNVAAKKLTEELRALRAPAKEPIAAPSPAPPVPAPVSAAPPVPEPMPVAPPVPQPLPMTPPALATAGSLFTKLESDWQRIMDEATQSKTTLRVMNSLAIWLCCPQGRARLTPPEQQQLDFAARATQREAIRRVLEHVGYQTSQSADEFRDSPRLYFSDPARGTNLEIYLDTFAMYHQLDLTPFLTPERAPLPETALLLLRLQLVEMPEAGLREIYALLLNHAVGRHDTPGAIDVSRIARLCADQWGWYKTVTMNLQRLLAFAGKSGAADEETIVVERAGQIRQTIDNAPKSLGWQARARLGESVRWYDTPFAMPEIQNLEIRD